MFALFFRHWLLSCCFPYEYPYHFSINLLNQNSQFPKDLVTLFTGNYAASSLSHAALFRPLVVCMCVVVLLSYDFLPVTLIPVSTPLLCLSVSGN